MYDSIKIVLSEKDLNNEISFMEEIPCRIVVSVCSENRAQFKTSVESHPSQR